MFLGTGFSGATCCVSGSTCVKQNEYYSQCLPGNDGKIRSNSNWNAD